MSQENAVNPYSAPDSRLVDPEPAVNENTMTREFCPPQKLRAKEGWSVFSDAWQIYKEAPVKWFFLVILASILMGVMSAVPYISMIISALMAPIMGGLIIAARDVSEGKSLEFSYLFAGFKANGKKLIGFGLVYQVIYIAIVSVIVVSMGATDIFSMMLGQAEDPEAVVAQNFDAYMIMGLAGTVIGFVFWLGIPLVAIQDQGIVESFRSSLTGCVRNILPLIVYVLALIFWVIVAVIPVGLGLIVLIPLLYILGYCLYSKIFTRPVAS